MRIVQLIDSLEAGGAERMAVNYANVLSEKVGFSGLVSTRNEGLLRSTISDAVCYEFIGKKTLFDLKSHLKFYKYCVRNKINVIHAHSTSLYSAVLIKMVLPSVKIVWHDHYGNSEFLERRSFATLKFASKFCHGAIAVNSKLKEWISVKLDFPQTIYLANFPILSNSTSETILAGIANCRIICVANLREQKNHLMLLKVAQRLKSTHPQWTFHFVGKDFNDGYSLAIREMITTYGLGDTVSLYGSSDDTASLIKQCDIAVLSSKSEGLPVALLEYGLLSRPVLATSVGEIPSIIQNGKNGYLAASGNEDEFHKKLLALIDDEERSKFGAELHKTISLKYGAESIIDIYLQWLKKL